MSQSIFFLGLILLAPMEMPSGACTPEQVGPNAPIPRYRRPPLPAPGTWYPLVPCEPAMAPGTGIIWHTAKKVGQPDSPVIHPEVDTMEFRPSDALPGDSRRPW